VKAWAEFYDYVLPHVPNCPLVMADMHIRMAAQQFCEKTLAWIVDLDPVKTTSAAIEYDIDMTSQQELVQITKATIDGKPVAVGNEANLPANWKTSAYPERQVFSIDRKTFFLIPQQSADLDVTLTVALKPSNLATGITNEIYANYVQDIADGAKAMLMMVPKKPYTDVALAAINESKFQSRCAEIAWQVKKSHGDSRLGVRPHFF
jgi:hypothetical protein